MKKAKELSKKMDMTFNDMVMGMTSKVLKQHFVAEGDKSESISVTMPFSFKTIPLKVKDYCYGNQFVSLTIYLKLYEDFKQGCDHAAKIMKKLKKSTQPGAMFSLLQFYGLFMPAGFCEKIGSTSGSKHTLMLTNVPGYVKPVYYGGQPAKRFFYAGSGTGNIATGIVLVSICKRT